MGDGDQTACRRNCWLTAAGAGLLLWVGLAQMAGFGGSQAFVAAVVAGLALRLFLVWAFCTEPETAAPAEALPVQPGAAGAAPPVSADPGSALPVAAVGAEVTPRPDPSVLAVREPLSDSVSAPAPEAATADLARKPAAKAKPAARAKSAPSKDSVPKAVARTAKPRAASGGMGLDAAMGRTKETAPADAGLLVQPRGGKGDDLKLIVGIGPALEKLLNGIGVWHFDQIAAWKARDIALVDSKMANFKGRISRDGWVKQARALARGETPKAKGDR
ncbi:MAG: hypothetical protein JSR87_04880 [Proteobacteria bacterium]|nr:hypothetical protein [Pseudomonadota bacterium]MBS0572587.1 hypothetical protein [Pseudomonadota bacterium]